MRLNEKTTVFVALSLALLTVISGLAVGVTDTTTGEQRTESMAQEQEDGVAISFENQTSNGSAVVVASVTLPEGGFVAVYNETFVTDETLLGSLAGSSDYLEAGTHENVTVQLNQSLNETQTVTVVPHRDGNENQQYDFADVGSAFDNPYQRDEGGLLNASATVTVAADGQMTATPTETATAMQTTTESMTTEATTAENMTTAETDTETTEG